MKYNKEFLEKLGKLYIEKNMSMMEISKELGINKETVKYCLRKGNYKKEHKASIICKKRVLTEKYGTDIPLKNELSIAKMKKTNLEKYGVDNPMKLKKIQNKVKQTNLEKYGCEYIFNTADFQTKSINTSQLKYGTDRPMQSDTIKQIYNDNFRKKYGVDNPMQVKEIKNRVFKTNLEKYGSISPASNPDIKRKIKNTVQRKYGVDNILNSEKIQNKIQNTNLEKYGSISPLGNKEIQDNIKYKFKQKYGQTNPLKNKSIRNKIQNTNLEKYGSISPLGNKDVRNKIYETNKKKYGCKYPIQNPEIHDKAIKTNIEKNCPSYNILRDKSLMQGVLTNIPEKERTSVRCANELNVNITTFLKWYNFHNLYANIHLQSQRSHYEQEIYNWLKEIYNGKIECNIKKFGRYEIDIYLPDIQLGIEFNGAYWHSVDMVEKNYHQNKSLYFKQLGIFIFHIYEWEWIDNNQQDKIKQHLKRLILNRETSIYARKCNVELIDNNIYRDFLNKYHLQGFVGAQIKLGLYYNNELVQIMSFGKARYSEHSYELLRLCTKNGYSIIGGANKLFHYFTNNYDYKTIISYCDIDKFTGKVYEKLNMQLDRINIPNYKWVKLDTFDIKSRYQTQKHKIQEGDNDLRSENEIMKANGYVKVENAGTYRFILNKEDVYYEN